MKTPEEMAEEYCDSKQLSYVERLVIIKGFLAGYQAAKDNQEYLMNEMSILRSRLDIAEKLSQLVDEEKEQ